MAILSKECKPDNFELHNSLKVSLRIFLHSNVVECESFLEDKLLYKNKKQKPKEKSI